MEITAVFLIWVQVTTVFGNAYFVQPTEKKYQRAFAEKSDCDAFAEPLRRSMKVQSSPPGITLNGVVCRVVPLETKR
jgi:hypothetical protein